VAYDSHSILASSDGNSKPAGAGDTLGTANTANSTGNTNTASTTNATHSH